MSNLNWKLTRAATACLGCVLWCSPAIAQNAAKPPQETPQQENPPKQTKIRWGAENDISSGYVWQGLSISDRPVVQPGAWISLSGLTFTAWHTATLGDTSEGTRPRVTNLQLDYERDWKKLRIKPALTTYFYRDPLLNVSSHSMESSMKFSYPVGPIRLFTTQRVDVLTYKGAYSGDAGVGYQRRVSEKAFVEGALHGGWGSAKFNETYLGLRRAAFNLAGIDVALTYYPRPHVYLRPHFGWSAIADAQLRAAAVRPTFFIFGLAIGVDY